MSNRKKMEAEYRGESSEHILPYEDGLIFIPKVEKRTMMTKEIEENKDAKSDLAKALCLLFQINNKAHILGRNGLDFLAHSTQREKLEALLIKNGIKPK